MRYERDDSLSKAAAYISQNIRTLPEFARARSIVMSGALTVVRGAGVEDMRTLGGYSNVIRRQIEALPDEFKANRGSKLLSRSVIDELKFTVPELREALQFILWRESNAHV
jgi:hypothetical protein